METKVKFEAVRLICCDCKRPFIFSAGEQTFFGVKVFQHLSAAPNAGRLGS